MKGIYETPYGKWTFTGHAMERAMDPVRARGVSLKDIEEALEDPERSTLLTRFDKKGKWHIHALFKAKDKFFVAIVLKRRGDIMPKVVTWLTDDIYRRYGNSVNLSTHVEKLCSQPPKKVDPNEEAATWLKPLSRKQVLTKDKSLCDRKSPYSWHAAQKAIQKLAITYPELQELASCVSAYASWTMEKYQDNPHPEDKRARVLVQDLSKFHDIVRDIRSPEIADLFQRATILEIGEDFQPNISPCIELFEGKTSVLWKYPFFDKGYRTFYEKSADAYWDVSKVKLAMHSASRYYKHYHQDAKNTPTEETSVRVYPHGSIEGIISCMIAPLTIEQVSTKDKCYMDQLTPEQWYSAQSAISKIAVENPEWRIFSGCVCAYACWTHELLKMDPRKIKKVREQLDSVGARFLDFKKDIRSPEVRDLLGEQAIHLVGKGFSQVLTPKVITKEDGFYVAWGYPMFEPGYQTYYSNLADAYWDVTKVQQAMRAAGRYKDLHKKVEQPTQ